MLRLPLQITAQVTLPPTKVLGKNDVPVDGLIDHCNIYFDIKAFGLHGHLARKLKKKLEHLLPGKMVFVEESWDLSVDEFSKLLPRANTIANLLRNQNAVSFGRLRIRAEGAKPVHVSAITHDPYLLAQENWRVVV